MVLWTRIKNSKSTSPHMKQETNPDLKRKKIVKSNDSGKKSKNNSKISTNKMLNSQIASFQSNSNEENKSNSKYGDSNSKKVDKNPHYFNNIKFKKYINIKFTLIKIIFEI